MQPYLFPYIGYFQLAAAVDEFWLLDTVQFIQQGWMNRNNLLINGRKTMFSIPVNKRPRIDLISNKAYGQTAARDCEKLVRTVRQAYAKAPYTDDALRLIEDFARHLAHSPQPADFTEATEYALHLCFDALGLTTPIRRISSLGLDDTLTGQERIIAACRAVGAQDYVNMIGGRDLYDADSFAVAGLSLHFLEPALPPYDQGHAGFEPGLSILDVIANVAPEGICGMLNAARIVQA